MSRISPGQFLSALVDHLDGRRGRLHFRDSEERVTAAEEKIRRRDGLSQLDGIFVAGQAAVDGRAGSALPLDGAESPGTERG